MTLKKDLIVGVYTNYSWDKIKYWVNSIDQSGFVGDKLMIIYNTDGNTLKKLNDKNFKVFGFKQNQSTGDLYYEKQFVVVVQRFLDLWNFFSKVDLSPYRYVIHTDVKDVVFQTNPSDWLTMYMSNAKILASCESLKYKDESWGNDNLKSSFPLMYNKLKDQPIWNCGVQAGEPETMRDLWYQIYCLCKTSPIANPDQAAYNVLLNLEPYKSITTYAMSENFWAAQLGTTMDPQKIQKFLPNLLEPQPIIINGYVHTSKGIRHCIVHQYDRIPELKDIIEKRYS